MNKDIDFRIYIELKGKRNKIKSHLDIVHYEKINHKELLTSYSRIRYNSLDFETGIFIKYSNYFINSTVLNVKGQSHS